jgi:uncharacterized protein (DUF3084 family)
VLREHVETNSTASHAAVQAAKASSDAVAQTLDQFNANAWGQIQMLRSILEQTDRAFRNFADAVVQSGSDMAAQAQGFNDILMTIHSSAETLATATERLADFAEDIGQDTGAPRAAPKREAIG